MREPWFRQRWFGYHPIHKNGWIAMLIYWALALPLLGVAIAFSGYNNTVAAGALAVLFFGTFASGAVTISRTEKR